MLLIFIVSPIFFCCTSATHSCNTIRSNISAKTWRKSSAIQTLARPFIGTISFSNMLWVFSFCLILLQLFTSGVIFFGTIGFKAWTITLDDGSNIRRGCSGGGWLKATNWLFPFLPRFNQLLTVKNVRDEHAQALRHMSWTDWRLGVTSGYFIHFKFFFYNSFLEWFTIHLRETLCS